MLSYGQIISLNQVSAATSSAIPLKMFMAVWACRFTRPGLTKYAEQSTVSVGAMSGWGVPESQILFMRPPAI